MAVFLPLTVALLLASLCFLNSISMIGASPTVAFASSPAYSSHELHHDLFEPILTNLGFQELAMAVPSLSDDSAFTAWNGPSTLFAPTDASIRSCSSCSVARLLREHIVPGLFNHDYLSKLAFGTKIETMDPGRCITVTFSTDPAVNNSTAGKKKIYIGGVEITRPDLFNNGVLIVHGLQGFVAPLSPFSCNIERMTSLSFPLQPDKHKITTDQTPAVHLIRLMLRDAMLRLRNNGFTVIALAMKLKYAELVNLHNMTIFAVDDVSIFAGSHSYVNNVRFHIVPNRFLAIYDLEKLPAGSLLPTLDGGNSLVVTTAGSTGGGTFTPMRINYVRIKVPDVVRNLKIVVHSLYLPFPHLLQYYHPYDGGNLTAGGEGYGSSSALANNETATDDSCSDSLNNQAGGGCVRATAMAPSGDGIQVKPAVEMEDYHGL